MVLLPAAMTLEEGASSFTRNSEKELEDEDAPVEMQAALWIAFCAVSRFLLQIQPGLFVYASA